MRKTFLIVISVICFSAFIIVNILRSIDKKEVLNDHLYTYGKIVSYSKIGDHRNPTLRYEYVVMGRLYTRTISPSIDYKECEKDIKLCDKKRFVVIFSKRDHSKSLINLKNEIEVNQELSKVDNFEEFE